MDLCEPWQVCRFVCVSFILFQTLLCFLSCVKTRTFIGRSRTNVDTPKSNNESIDRWIFSAFIAVSSFAGLDRCLISQINILQDYTSTSSYFRERKPVCQRKPTSQLRTIVIVNGTMYPARDSNPLMWISAVRRVNWKWCSCLLHHWTAPSSTDIEAVKCKLFENIRIIFNHLIYIDLYYLHRNMNNNLPLSIQLLKYDNIHEIYNNDKWALSFNTIYNWFEQYCYNCTVCIPILV